MSEQVGGLGKSLQRALSGVVIIYLAAIGLTILLILVSELFSTIFPNVPNVFPLIYNTVRNITLFILVVPFAIGLVGSAFAVDTVTDIFFPILHGILPDIFVLAEGTNLVEPATNIVTTIQGFIESLFPTI